MHIVFEQEKAGTTNNQAVLKGDGRDSHNMVQLSCSEGTDHSDHNGGGGGSGFDHDDNGGVGNYNGEGGDGDDGGGISCDMYDGGSDHGDGGSNNDDNSGGDGSDDDDDSECFDGCGSGLVDIEYNDDRDDYIGYGDDVHHDDHGVDHGDSDDHGDGDDHGNGDHHGDDHGNGDDHGDDHGSGDDHGDGDDNATKGVGMVQHVSTVQKNKLPTSLLYPGAPISMKASWFACNYFARTNNLSDAATKQLLNLIAIHCIDKNNCALSTYVLRKRLEIDVQSEIKKFCSQCFKEIKDTNNCICSQKKSAICYLTFLPFDKHLVNIFEGIN